MYNKKKMYFNKQINTLIPIQFQSAAIKNIEPKINTSMLILNV